MRKYFLILILLISIGMGCKKEATSTSSSTAFTLSSEAVVGGMLLDAYKCEQKVAGVEKSIPLAWTNAPATAKSFAITMVHYPNPADSVNLNCYLLLWGIDQSVTHIDHGMADKGQWYMGSNKDGTAVSYTSPCSKGAGTHQYTITIYALSETPASLPSSSSLNVNYATMKTALSSVKIIDKATLVFNSINN